MAVFSGQDFPDPSAISWGALADIDGDIEDFTHNCSYKLALRVMELIVQTAQDTLSGTGMVVLHKILMPAKCIKLRLTEGLQEKSPMIAKDFGLNQNHFRNGSANKFHYKFPPR